MLIRTVRMTFRENEIDTFKAVFEASKEQIRNFPGCRYLELWQDYDNPSIFLTYSHWVNDEALEGYRQSDLFKEVWAKTKPLFADKPLAFSSKALQRLL